MKSIGRFEVLLGVALAAVYFALFAWLSPGERSRLSPAEVDSYVARLRGKLPAPLDEERVFLERLRAWGAADDGRPVYMLNVMRHYEQLRPVPGAERIRLSPAAANAHYESEVMPLLLRQGGYPVFIGNAAGLGTIDGLHADLIGTDRSQDKDDRILIVRYPNRRAFLELVSDPRYLKVAPCKFAAVHLALVPLRAETVPPDPRWILGGLMLVTWIVTAALRARRKWSG